MCQPICFQIRCIGDLYKYQNTYPPKIKRSLFSIAERPNFYEDWNACIYATGCKIAKISPKCQFLNLKKKTSGKCHKKI